MILGTKGRTALICNRLGIIDSQMPKKEQTSVTLQESALDFTAEQRSASGPLSLKSSKRTCDGDSIPSSRQR